jgi:hypothetical protein
LKIYRKLIPTLVKEIVARLVEDRDIEIAEGRIDDAREDLSAILRSYCDVDDRVTELAKEAMERRSIPMSRLQSVRQTLARDKRHLIGDEGIDYVIDQMLEFLLISRNIEEVFSDDHTMRRKVYQVMKKHLDVDEELDRMARARLRHLQDGTNEWDIEYNKEVERLKRLKGLV